MRMTALLRRPTSALPPPYLHQALEGPQYDGNEMSVTAEAAEEFVWVAEDEVPEYFESDPDYSSYLRQIL